MSKQTECHTGYRNPIIKFEAKFLEDINVEKAYAFISLELDVLIDGVCILNKLNKISLNKGSIKFQMMS